MEEIQIEEERGGATTDKIYKNSTEIEKNCLDWYNKYEHAYNY
jgi:hypothetical protein